MSYEPKIRKCLVRDSDFYHFSPSQDGQHAAEGDQASGEPTPTDERVVTFRDHSGKARWHEDNRQVPPLPLDQGCPRYTLCSTLLSVCWLRVFPFPASSPISDATLPDQDQVPCHHRQMGHQAKILELVLELGLEVMDLSRQGSRSTATGVFPLLPSKWHLHISPTAPLHQRQRCGRRSSWLLGGAVTASHIEVYSVPSSVTSSRRCGVTSGEKTFTVSATPILPSSGCPAG